jgi:hypothetical protein
VRLGEELKTVAGAADLGQKAGAFRGVGVDLSPATSDVQLPQKERPGPCTTAFLDRRVDFL